MEDISDGEDAFRGERREADADAEAPTKIEQTLAPRAAWTAGLDLRV